MTLADGLNPNTALIPIRGLNSQIDLFIKEQHSTWLKVDVYKKNI